MSVFELKNLLSFIENGGFIPGQIYIQAGSDIKSHVLSNDVHMRKTGDALILIGETVNKISETNLESRAQAERELLVFCKGWGGVFNTDFREITGVFYQGFSVGLRETYNEAILRELHRVAANHIQQAIETQLATKKHDHSELTTRSTFALPPISVIIQ